MDDNMMDYDDSEIMELEFEDGEKVDCLILCVFDVEFEGEDRAYIALEEVEKDGEPIDDGAVYFYRYHEDDENSYLENFEDDAEFAAVDDAFQALVDDGLFGDEEE